MRSHTLFWKLFPFVLLLTLLTIVTALSYSLAESRRLYSSQLHTDLEARARLTARLMAGRMEPGQAAWLEAQCREIDRTTATRVTVILPPGKVLADSEKAAAEMEDHTHRPEIKAAVEGQVGQAIHFSRTLKKRMFYVAVPVYAEGRLQAVIRTALPMLSIDQTITNVRRDILVGGLLLTLCAGIASWWLARRFSQPLAEMEQAARYFARGDFQRRIPMEGVVELDDLAVVMNRMAAQLEEKILLLERQTGEQAAVLTSMIEGVLAVDGAEKIITINQSATRLLDVSADRVKGRSIQESIRHPELQQLIEQALHADNQSFVEGDIILFNGEEKYLQVHGTPLRDARGNNLGVVVVLNDVTRLRRLENVRRDFVANVSHELKTPITSIKGFIETLQDGALQEPENARRFLDIMAKQSDRLNSIIEDLLSLSRIEQEADQGKVPLKAGGLAPVLEAATSLCQVKAREKDIQLRLTMPADLPMLRINDQLLEQAVVNLIDNAVKYSDPGKDVEIGAEVVGSDVRLFVRDHGCGISAEHLSRIFERFYRVDKARSRQLGGTGLGLAIVKHIVQAHGGRVTVESTPGQGSIFFIVLPIVTAA